MWSATVASQAVVTAAAVIGSPGNVEQNGADAVDAAAAEADNKVNGDGQIQAFTKVG
jgi:hypothetical protein